MYRGGVYRGGGVPAKDSPHTAKAPLHVFPSRGWCTGGVSGYENPCPISHWIPRTLELNITIKGCTGDVPGYIYIYTKNKFIQKVYRGCTGTYIYIYIRFGECCTGPACTGARPNFCMLPYIVLPATEENLAGQSLGELSQRRTNEMNTCFTISCAVLQKTGAV